MRVFSRLEDVTPGTFWRGTAVAIGKFDGVHRGHLALLRRVAAVAEQKGLDPLVFTFANNPLSVLNPELCPERVMSVGQRIDALADEGVEACVIVPFDEELAKMPAEDFVEEVLVERLRVAHICVGADFRFGNRGAGTPKLLEDMGERLAFSVEIVDDVEDEEGIGKVSSTRIREAILQGDVASAGRMMDRPVALRGRVVHGDARGRELGFPTANLGGEIEGLRPADGVYAGWAIIDGERYEAAISVGANVTFDPEGEPRVEAFIMDFSGDLYGDLIELRFVERLRGMAAFASVEALIARMNEDVREARLILAGR